MQKKKAWPDGADVLLPGLVILWSITEGQVGIRQPFFQQDFTRHSAHTSLLHITLGWECVMCENSNLPNVGGCDVFEILKHTKSGKI